MSCAAKPAERRPGPAKPAPQSANSQDESAYSNLKAVATGSQITDTDTKTGRILWTAHVAYSTAQSGSTTSDLTATFHDVHGVFYAGGKPADRFSAPVVTADYKSQTVTATGGVTVTSITQAGARVRSDRMVWYSKENKLVGVGHVIFQQGGISQTMPSFQADTRLKKIVSPAPGIGGTLGRAIHTQIKERKAARE